MNAWDPQQCGLSALDEFYFTSSMCLTWSTHIDLVNPMGNSLTKSNSVTSITLHLHRLYLRLWLSLLWLRLCLVTHHLNLRHLCPLQRQHLWRSSATIYTLGSWLESWIWWSTNEKDRYGQLHLDPFSFLLLSSEGCWSWFCCYLFDYLPCKDNTWGYRIHCQSKAHPSISHIRGTGIIPHEHVAPLFRC